MADLGESSRPDTAHKHKMTSWITVLLLVAASIVLGVAFVLQSVPLGVVGVVLGIVGIVLGVTGRIMDDAY
jgi:uncharacterized membrane protein YoaK (UPF0700 family)